MGGDAFVSSSRTMNDDFSPLSEFSIFTKLCSINPAEAQGPDGIPGWLLKEHADLLAPPVMDIINSYLPSRRPVALILERSRCRGTQRICSSHYLFPRGILLAGKNTGFSMSWLGNFVIDRGFAWELLTFSSISIRAGCRNSEDWGRLKKKKKKRTPYLSQTYDGWSQWLRLRKKNLFCPGFVAFVRSFWIEGFERARNSWLGNKFDQLAGKPTNFI